MVTPWHVKGFFGVQGSWGITVTKNHVRHTRGLLLFISECISSNIPPRARSGAETEGTGYKYKKSIASNLCLMYFLSFRGCRTTHAYSSNYKPPFCLCWKKDGVVCSRLAISLKARTDNFKKRSNLTWHACAKPQLLPRLYNCALKPAFHRINGSSNMEVQSLTVWTDNTVHDKRNREDAASADS